MVCSSFLCTHGMAKTSKVKKPVTITFKSIPSVDGKGYAVLEIMHPGPFDEFGYSCYVGGCGVGNRKSFEEALSLLQDKAIEHCRRIVTRSQAQVDHYQSWLDRLDTIGLEPK